MLPSDVTKKIVAAGKAKNSRRLPPYPDGTKIEFHFRTVKSWAGSEEGHAVLDDTRIMRKPMTLVLGKQFKIPLWEQMLQTMLEGEIAKFEVPSNHVISYPLVSKAVRQSVSGKGDHKGSGHHCCGMMAQGTGYPDLDRFMKAPEDLTFYFDILNVIFPEEYEKEAWQLTDEEKKDSIPRLKADGNDLFNEKKYEEAGAKYFEAIARLEQLLLKEHPNSDEAADLKRLKVTLLLNYAMTLMKKKEYYEAITHLDTALEIEPDNVKGLYRRGDCHKAVGNFEESKKDMNRAAFLQPSLFLQIAKAREEIEQGQKEQDAKDKQIYQKMFQAKDNENK